jgi:hypothetical protein
VTLSTCSCSVKKDWSYASTGRPRFTVSCGAFLLLFTYEDQGTYMDWLLSDVVSTAQVTHCSVLSYDTVNFGM